MRMNNEIFRKKSLDRINSPEDLNEYIRVTNPGTWMLLFGIIVLLIGAIIWGYYGSVETWENAKIFVNDGQSYCLVRPEAGRIVKPGMTVDIDDEYTGTIVKNTHNAEDGAIFLLDIDIPDGTYTGKILVEEIRPKMLIFN